MEGEKTLAESDGSEEAFTEAIASSKRAYSREETPKSYDSVSIFSSTVNMATPIVSR